MVTDHELQDEISESEGGLIGFVDVETGEMVLECECCGAQARETELDIDGNVLRHRPWCICVDDIETPEVN